MFENFEIKRTVMNAAVSAGNFTKEVCEFAFPGMVVGTGVIIAMTPTVFGITALNAQWLIILALIMLVAGVCFVVVKRVIEARLIAAITQLNNELHTA